MTLIKSISGIRGTIGGNPGDCLSPIDIVKFSSAFALWASQATGINKIVIGRDARPSGQMVTDLVKGALTAVGVDVVDLGLSTTPTVEMAVTWENAAGGVIITASHNPVEWNALKLLNDKGEFISDDDGKKVLELAESALEYVTVDKLGKVTANDTYLDKHIDAILALDAVNVEEIRNANLSVAVDAVNSTGGTAIPLLLEKLGVNNVEKLYCEPNGQFPHNPEPLAEHLTDLSALMQSGNHDLGIVVDPDVDRLAFVCEDGSMYGEEYTLVTVADYLLEKNQGNSVSNLSSTRALRDVTETHGGKYYTSAVGEVNVVAQMKDCSAVIGGEGNGGVILPDLHYGRDALAGIAIFLSQYVKKGLPLSALRDSYPQYKMAKKKIQLTPEIDVDAILSEMATRKKEFDVNLIDGVKIDFPDSWVHLRKSNTEPIIRIYSEAETLDKANELADSIIDEIKSLTNK